VLEQLNEIAGNGMLVGQKIKAALSGEELPPVTLQQLRAAGAVVEANVWIGKYLGMSSAMVVKR
jgi:hypothetical protein